MPIDWRPVGLCQWGDQLDHCITLEGNDGGMDQSGGGGAGLKSDQNLDIFEGEVTIVAGR